MDERITTCGVCERDGRYLVGKRVPGGAIGSRWEFIGGKNRWGETEADTLRREWMEELGVRIDVGPFVTSYDFVNKDTRYHLKAYRVSLLPGQVPHLKYHTELRWVDGKELAALDFAPSDAHVVSVLTGGQPA